MSFYHRSSRSLALIAAILALAFAGCDAADPSDGLVHGVSLKKDRLQIYDWSYASLDRSATPIYQSQGRIAARIAATNDRVGKLSDLVRLETYMVEYEDEMHVTWYRQTRSDLRDLASVVNGRIPVLPLKQHSETLRPLSPYGLPKTVSMLLNDRLAKAGQEDTVQFRTDPRIVFVYPLEEGASWTGFTSPFVQTREVLGYRDVNVKAGTFRCAEIRTRMPELAPTTDWVDCVSEAGLVLRVVSDEKERRDAQNNPIGTFRTEERLELVLRSGESPGPVSGLGPWSCPASCRRRLLHASKYKAQVMRGVLNVSYVHRLCLPGSPGPPDHRRSPRLHLRSAGTAAELCQRFSASDRIGFSSGPKTESEVSRRTFM